MRPKVLILLLVAAGIVYFLYLYQGAGGVKAGEPAPEFTLPLKTGGVATLGQFRGRKTVLLNFWATWCPPCLQEMPSLENLKRRMEGRNFEILAASLDEKGWGEVEEFMKKVPLTMTLLLDARGDVASMYGTYRLPESFLIDRNGVVVGKFVGPKDWNDPKIVARIMKYVER